MENLFLYQKAKASYSSIIKSIFINILHKLKRKIYSWHLLCLKLSSNIANDNKRDQVHDEKIQCSISGNPKIGKTILKLSTLSLSMMCLTMAQAAETEQSSTDENQQKS